MNTREFNKKVRKKVEELVGWYSWNVSYYCDKRKGGRRKVFKSYGSRGWKEIWERVLEEMDLEKEGWSMYEGFCHYRGDGSVYGIVKREYD